MAPECITVTLVLPLAAFSNSGSVVFAFTLEDGQLVARPTSNEQKRVEAFKESESTSGSTTGSSVTLSKSQKRRARKVKRKGAAGVKTPEPSADPSSAKDYSAIDDFISRKSRSAEPRDLIDTGLRVIRARLKARLGALVTKEDGAKNVNLFQKSGERTLFVSGVGSTVIRGPVAMDHSLASIGRSYKLRNSAKTEKNAAMRASGDRESQAMLDRLWEAVAPYVEMYGLPTRKAEVEKLRYAAAARKRAVVRQLAKVKPARGQMPR